MAPSLYQDRLAYNYRTLPWHGDGTPIEDDVTVEEAVEVHSRTNYPVMLAVPHGFRTLDGQKDISPDMIEEGSSLNAIAVLRGPSYDDPNYAVLGKASEKFTILQNIDLARMVEPLRQWGRVETVGALDNGARFFISFEGGSWSFMVNGKEDVQNMYLVVKNTHLPGECLQFQLTHVRPVCKNTWIAGDQSAFMNLPLAHYGDLKQVTQWVINTLNSLPEKRDRIKSDVEYMASSRVTDKIVKLGIDYAIPMPGHHRVAQVLKEQVALNLPPELAMVAADIDGLIQRKDRDMSVQQMRITSLRNSAWQTYLESETVDRGNAWGAFNAITETIDHVVRSETAIRQTRKAMSSNFWGERAGWKLNAWEFFNNQDKWDN